MNEVDIFGLALIGMAIGGGGIALIETILIKFHKPDPPSEEIK